MHTIVTTQQINHFAQFGWIEFEGFLSPENCAEFSHQIEQVLAKRLNAPSDRLSRFSNDRLYAVGRDCWRDSSLLKQLLCSQRLAHTASQLSNKPSLQLACDQWIPMGHSFAPLNMSAHLSFQNLSCGCLLHLTGPHAGQARFFQPHRLPLFADSQLLIAYGQLNTIYVHNPLDPSNTLLKQFGYEFGDRLNPQQHPPCKPQSFQ